MDLRGETQARMQIELVDSDKGMAWFTEDGEHIVGGLAHVARVWDRASGEPVGPLFSHGRLIMQLRASSDARYVFARGANQTAELLDTGQTRFASAPHLTKLACDTQLHGARRITGEDAEAAPILAGRIGEDV